VERLAGSETEEGEMAASLRQVELLQALATALHSAEEALAERPIEVALIDLKDALRRASLLLGVEVGDVILETIFSRFCVGK
jgi:tRNA U34 5-carboxymethylaminomethyl modifying GTPase MnmE/TrmE